MTTRRALLLCTLLLFPATASAASLFSPNRIHLYATGGKSQPNWHGQSDIQSLYVETNYNLSKRTEFGLATGVHSIVQPRSWFGDLYGDGNENVRAVSSALLIRRHFRVGAPVAQPYIELTTGPMWATRRVPAATSRFNFISQAGFGFVLHPQRRRSWIFGYRLGHISNAGYQERNSGLNIHSLLAGARWSPAH